MFLGQVMGAEVPRQTPAKLAHTGLGDEINQNWDKPTSPTQRPSRKAKNIVILTLRGCRRCWFRGAVKARLLTAAGCFKKAKLSLIKRNSLQPDVALALRTIAGCKGAVHALRKGEGVLECAR